LPEALAHQYRSAFTASLTSSVIDYPVEHGRRYHAFRAGSKYFIIYYYYYFSLVVVEISSRPAPQTMQSLNSADYPLPNDEVG